jgi:hypothetical protein
MKTTRQVILDCMKEEEENIEYHEKIAHVLGAYFPGKQINKRLETKLQTLFPGETWSLYTTAGQCYVQIWGGKTGRDFNNRRRHFLGYTGSLGTNDLAAYDPAVFEDRDICHGSAAHERQESRKATLATNEPEEIDALLFNYTMVQANLKEALETVEDHYSILENHKIKL